MEPLIINIVGYTASVVGTSLMLPQMYRSLKTKSVEDLSWGMLILYFLNCALWLVYGVLIYAMPVIITNGLALVIGTFQIGLKVKYSKRP